MRDMENRRSQTKQIWVVMVLSLVLILCMSGLLWLVWTEPEGLPVSVPEEISSQSEAPSSRPSSSSKANSSSKIESSEALPSSSLVLSNSPVSYNNPVQHNNVAASIAPVVPIAQNLTINAAMTHDGKATYYNVFINADGVALKNKLVEGDLVISETVGNGTVTLQNVVVKGRILVNGAQTVTLRDVTAVRIVAQRASGTTDYIISGDSTIHQMAAKNQLTIDEGRLSGEYAGIKKLTTERGVPVWQQVSLLEGALDEVTTNDATNLMLSDHSSVERVVANAPTHIGGRGWIYSLTVCSNDVSFEKEPRNVEVKDKYNQPSEQNWAIGQTEIAVNGGDHSGSSVWTLATPRNLTMSAAAAEDSVTLAFDSVGNASGYRIIYSVTNASNALNITNQQLLIDTNSYTINNALLGQAGTVVTFKVRAESSSSRYTASQYSAPCTKTVVVLDSAQGIALI